MTLIFSKMCKLALLLVLSSHVCTALAVDWNGAPSQAVTLFYPGAATWEAMLIGEDHPGATAVRQRVGCKDCHQGQQQAKGITLATDSNNPLFRAHRGMTSWQTSLQIARDADRIYFRIDTGDLEQGQVSLLIDDGAYESSALSGCWATCHQDSRGMPAAGNMNLTKYLSRSRTTNTRTGGGQNFKPEGELKQLIQQNQFLELIGASFSPSEALPLHGYVLERRHMTGDSRVAAEGTGGHVIISRPLAAGSEVQKIFETGKVYSAGLALHSGTAEGSDHLVSFPVLFELGEDGGIRIIDEN